MRKAIATFGIGPHRELLALAMPTFIEYAARHDYEVVIGTGESDGRPPPWGKVPLLQTLLRDYDFVLWLDADIVILDFSVDLARVVPQSAFQALGLSAYESANVPVPNTGVWALRNIEVSHRFLSEVWRREDLIDSEYWEQDAVVRILGWSEKYCKVTQTHWDEGTHYLPEEWDIMPVGPLGYGQGFIRHYGGLATPQRLNDMRTDLAGIAASRHTGPARVPPLIRHNLGRAQRFVEIHGPERVRKIPGRVLRLIDDPMGVLERRLRKLAERSPDIT